MGGDPNYTLYIPTRIQPLSTTLASVPKLEIYTTLRYSEDKKSLPLSLFFALLSMVTGPPKKNIYWAKECQPPKSQGGFNIELFWRYCRIPWAQHLFFWGKKNGPVFAPELHRWFVVFDCKVFFPFLQTIWAMKKNRLFSVYRGLNYPVI